MRRVWAIVRLTVAESLRTRVAVAFIVLLVGVMVLLVATATGDGTVRGKIQMFMSYAMGMTHFLLALLVSFLACRTLDQDIKTQRIDSLVCKPLARWQLLLGRWLGILLIALFLFALSMGLTYGMVRYYARSAPPDSEDQFRINNQVLVARRAYKPPLPNVEDIVAKKYNQLAAERNLPADKKPSEIRQMLRDELIRQSRTVPPQQARTWVIPNIPPPKSGDVVITLRFKYEPGANTDKDESAGLKSNTIYGQWIIGRRESKQVYVQRPEEKPYRTLHEMNIPINAIEPDGTLPVTFINGDPRQVPVHLPIEDGIEVLVREGDFTPNFIRTALITFFTIIFVVTLALTCGTFLSFPIASLVTLSAFFIGLAGNFLNEAIGMQYGFAWSPSLLENIEKVITVIALQLVPVLDIGAYTSRLIDGQIVDWHEVTLKLGTLVIIKAGVLAVFAAGIFYRRELGKVTV